jgi:zinc transport system ATP-binding protein
MFSEGLKEDCIVSLDGVSFAYNGGPVLKDVNMRVNAGDYMAVIGPNGAAKSTLIKIMLGLLRPKTGNVRLFGQTIEKFRGWHMVGYVSQQAGMINTSFPATVEEVIYSGYYVGFGKMPDRQKVHSRVREAMSTVGITDLSNKLIGELSGGQRQKVFLAKALVKNPKALFMDEPTTGVDAGFRKEFYQLLSELNKNQNITVVIVTHDIGAVFDKAEKIACVSDRQVFVHENTAEVTEEHIADVFGYRIGTMGNSVQEANGQGGGKCTC